MKDMLFRRRIISSVSLIVVLLLASLATWFIWSWLDSFSQEGFREYIRSFGFMGWAVLLLLQVLQVFVALIPGELLETAAGFAFGPIWGTLICYLGVAAGSAIIFSLVRSFGIRFVELFIPRERINRLRFINTDKKRNNLIFLIFLIPGTPKDLITYFAGLTDIKLGSFLIISLIARFPSVVSSTIGGHLLGEGDYLKAVLLYAVTGIISMCGIMIYNHIIKRNNAKK